MYGTKTIAATPTIAAVPTLAYTGLNVGWMLLTVVVLLVCGGTLIRLARTSPKAAMHAADNSALPRSRASWLLKK